MIQPISLAFCGHLGTKQLAGVALALSVSVNEMLTKHYNQQRIEWIQKHRDLSREQMS